MDTRRWQQLGEVYGAVRGIDPSGRLEAVNRLCDGDRALVDEVISLLNQADAADSEDFLVPAQADEAELPLHEPLSAGTRIGPYAVEKLLGSGGMGAVYLARRVEDFPQVVALKVIGQALTPPLLKRFHAERKLLALLSHPNIVRLLSGGTTETGLPYLVMEHVDGKPLDNYCDSKRLDARRRADFVRQIALAVAYAHEHEVLHRDLKPANVLVTPDGIVKVTDFGLARSIGDGKQTTLSGHSTIAGTPSYMAPEQIAGGPERNNATVDCYGLGAILYHLLAGKPPFDGDTALQTCLKVTSEDVVSPRRLEPTIPKDLETICLKCLEKNAARRYASAEELAEDLTRFLTGRPIAARPVSAAEKLGSLARRHPAMMSLVAAVGVLLVIMTIGAGLMARREHQLRVTVEEAKQREATRADALSYIHHIDLANRAVSGNLVDRADELLDECPSSLRGWEWNYLKRLRQGIERVLVGHSNRVTSIAFSPDGRRLASASWDGTVKIWDVEASQELVTLKGHSEKVTCVAYSPDGRCVSSSSHDRTVKVWDAATGREMLTLREPSDKVFGVAYHPAGTLVAAVCIDGNVLIWDARTGALEYTFSTATGEKLYYLAFSPDGTQIAAAGEPGIVQVWDVATGHPILTARRPDQKICCGVTFNSDGECLSYLSEGRSAVDLFDPRSGQAILTLEGHTGAVCGVALGPGGTRIATASTDMCIRIWNALTGEELLTLDGHTRPPRTLAFSPDGLRIASGGEDMTIRIWDATPLRAGESLRPDDLTLRGHTANVTDVAFSADGTRVVSSSEDGTVKVWSVDSGQTIATLRGHNNHVQGVAVSRDGTRLASMGRDGCARIWDMQTGNEIRVLSGSARQWDAAFSPDGQHLATAGADRTLKLWNVESGESTLTLTGLADDATSLGFSPDGTRIASAEGDELKLRETDTGRVVCTMKARAGTVWRALYSPDGTHIASGHVDGSVRVWDAATGTEIQTLKGHRDTVCSVDFSPDGRLVASAGRDRSIRVWNLKIGRESYVLRGHAETVYGVAFSPNGQRVASAGADGLVKIWRLEP
jgi:WD40 repeat protein